MTHTIPVIATIMSGQWSTKTDTTTTTMTTKANENNLTRIVLTYLKGKGKENSTDGRSNQKSGGLYLRFSPNSLSISISFLFFS